MLGIKTPVNSGTPSRGLATIPLDDKRLLIQHVIEQRGVSSLIKLGQGLKKLVHEPTHRALCTADSPQELIRRWLRLERYIHSRHSTDMVACESNSMTIRHFALSGYPPPMPAEDLVILGVLLSLMEVIGIKQLKVTIQGREVYPDCDVRSLERNVENRATSEWYSQWTTIKPPLGVYSMAAVSAELIQFENWSPLARKVFVALADQPMLAATIRSIASEQGLSDRTLQRKLAEEGLSFSMLLARARSLVASKALLVGKESISEVGFLCGYSDQAHFTREFKKSVGMPPGQYREAFTSRSSVHR